MQDLDEAVRRHLAWDSIVEQGKELNLDPNQQRQAETQRNSANATVSARLPEAYQWLLVPVQDNPTDAVRIDAFRLSGLEALAVRASKKLKADELLVTGLAGTRLRMELDRVPLWRGDHVSIGQLVDDFARYHYLPRLVGPDVLIAAVRDGLGLLLWEQDGFAYADSFDEDAGRYRGLRAGQLVNVSEDDLSGLLVKPEVAMRQMERERAEAGTSIGEGSPVAAYGTARVDAQSSSGDATVIGAAPAGVGAVSKVPARYHGSVRIDPTRAGRDAGKIADEVLAHLVGVVGASVKVTLEIEADIPAGAPDHVVRTVTENSRTLKFETGSGFEQE